MAKITYEYLAKRDLSDAEVLAKGGSPSATGRLIQQAIEKTLKQCIEDFGSTEDIPLLSIHNLTKLYDRAASLGGVISNGEDRKMMSVIKDYYFDLNYPGEECRELAKEEALEALTFAYKFIGQVKSKIMNSF